MESITNIFKSLSEETRIRIMRVLIEAKKELCVCEIVCSLNEPQYNVSRHLNALKNAGLVKDRRQGLWIFYSLPLNNNQFSKKLIETIKSIPVDKSAQDLIRLKKRLNIRMNGKCIVGYKPKRK